MISKETKVQITKVFKVCANTNVHPRSAIMLVTALKIATAEELDEFMKIPRKEQLELYEEVEI